MNLRNLDMLRGFLAVYVLLGHARTLLWMSWNDWRLMEHGWLAKLLAASSGMFQFGYEAVMVFFVLSGFFIHLRLVLDSRQAGAPAPFSTWDFLLRRARRLLPPYYATLLFTVMLDSIGLHWFPGLYHANTGDTLIDSMFAGKGFTWPNIWTALIAQPGVLGEIFTGNGPLWSIQREVFYYCMYPLFALLWLRSRWLAYTLGFGFGALCNIVPDAVGWLTPVVGSHVFWLAGALLAEILTTRPRPSVFRWWRIVIPTAIGLGCLVMLRFVLPQGPQDVPRTLLLLVFGIAVVLAFGALPSQAVSWTPGRLLEWLGVRSYSIYIFHYPPLVLLSAWHLETYGCRPAHGWLALAGAALALLAGLAAFQCVEQRFLPRRMALPGAASDSVSSSRPPAPLS